MSILDSISSVLKNVYNSTSKGMQTTYNSAARKISDEQLHQAANSEQNHFAKEAIEKELKRRSK